MATRNVAGVRQASHPSIPPLPSAVKVFNAGDNKIPVASKPLVNVPMGLPQLSPLTPQTDRTRAQGNNSILSAPVPQRAMKSPILSFQLPAKVDKGSQPVPETPQKQSPWQLTPSFSVPVQSPFQFSNLGSADEVKDNTVTKVSTPLSHGPDKIVDQVDSTRRRQLLFEKQERLLQDELSNQERERRTKLEEDERQQQNSMASASQRNLERQVIRQQESERLKAQKMASAEIERRERAKREERKVQREKDVHFYSEEVLNSIMLEHILAVNAEALAIAFYRKRLLRNVLLQLKKVATRSMRRIEAHHEQTIQLRLRRIQLNKALAQLDQQSRIVTKSPRRPFHGPQFPDEDFLEEIILKVESVLQELIVGKRRV